MLKFSLIMSIYDKIKVDDLINAIKGIKNQSLKPSEIIIIVDGYCKLKLVFNLKKYLELYFKGKYKIFYNKKNKGIPFSYNKAIRYSNFKFIAINDADDYSHYNRFKIQIKYLYNHNKVGIVGSYVREINKNQAYIKKVPIKNQWIKFLSLIKNPMNHPTIMFNRSKFFKDIKYENCERMEDYYLWIRAIHKNVIFSNIPAPLITTKLNVSFYKRRSGLNLVKSELKIMIYLMKKSKFLFLVFIVIFLIKSIYHLMPSKIKPNIRKVINSF